MNDEAGSGGAARLLLAVATTAHAQLGSIGTGLMRAKQIADIKITDEEEVEIGTLVSENIRKRYGVVQDKAVHRYVSLVGMAVAITRRSAPTSRGSSSSSTPTASTRSRRPAGSCTSPRVRSR